MNGYFVSFYFISLLQGFYLTVVLLLGVSVTAVVGYPSGAPTQACTTITPDHNVSTATGSVPYIVNISSLDNGYVPGQNYTSEYCTCYKDTCKTNCNPASSIVAIATSLSVCLCICMCICANI